MAIIVGDSRIPIRTVRIRGNIPSSGFWGSGYSLPPNLKPRFEANLNNNSLTTQAIFYMMAVTAWLQMEFVELKDISVNNLGKDPLSQEIPRLVFFDTAGWRQRQSSTYCIPDGMHRMLERTRPVLLKRLPKLNKEFNGRSYAMWTACVGNVGPFANTPHDGYVTVYGGGGYLMLGGRGCLRLGGRDYSVWGLGRGLERFGLNPPALL